MAELLKERKKGKSKAKTKEAKKDPFLDNVQIKKNEEKSENKHEGILVEDSIENNTSLQEIKKESLQHDCRKEIEAVCKISEPRTKELNIVKDATPQDYTKLNDELHVMHPFFQSQKQLGQATQLDELSDEKVTLSTLAIDSNLKSVDQAIESMSLQDNESIKNEDECLESERIQAFTETQLSSLYYNTQLEEKQAIISDFLEYDNQTNKHEFYELVLLYLQSRTSLLGHQKDLASLKKDYENRKTETWTFEDHVTTEEGTCEDDELLTVKCDHQVAVFHQDISNHISRLLKQIRENIFDQQSLILYSAELYKLKVENYLLKATSCPYFVNLPQACEPPPDYLDSKSKYSKEISHLRDCISVLFAFCRRNVQDKTFVRDIHSWLIDLVAVLLRIADSKDHFFILNHLLRCPPGTGDWAVSLLQVPSPKVIKDQHLLGSTILDHSLVILSILMEPVKNREKYLEHYGKSQSTIDGDARDTIWVLVDSSGDEEEDACDVWHLFTENDVIQFMNQIPFEGIFRHILFIDESDASRCHERKFSMHSTLKFFAFCTCLVGILQKGLSTFSKARYKGVIKRITRLIRHVVNYATDHLKSIISRHKDLENEDPALYSRLLIEYDEFFERTIRVVFLFPHSGAWQFLAVIPYSTVSLVKLQQIAYRMHVGYESLSEDIENIQEPASFLMHPNTRGQFQDLLLRLNESDVFYLLTALGNMAVARPIEEIQLINVLVKSLFDASFLNADTRELLNRTGRDLLSTIVGSHPFVLSTLLALTQENLQSLGNLCLYLFNFLDYQEWTPSEEDIQCLSYWLLFSPISSLENQLSRIIFEKLNWGLSKDNSSLFLPRKLHQRVALLLVDASLKVASTIQGGILSEGVKHVTSMVYSSSQEQSFFKWSWSLMNVLRLHQLDQPFYEVRNLMRDQSLLLKGVEDPSSSPSLNVIQHGIANKNSFAFFSALLMSSWGHSIPEFCAHGPENLEYLISEGHYEAALTVISLITPLFFHQHEELSSDSKFMGVIQKLATTNQTYIGMAKSFIIANSSNGIRDLFSSLILEQIYSYKKFNFTSSEVIVKFWMHLLTGISDWRSNKGVLKFIDDLCLHSLFDVRLWQVIKDILSEQRKDLMRTNSDARGLGSLLTWVTSNPSAPCSLLAASSCPDFPWYALTVFLLECEEQVRSGLWKNLLGRFQENPSLDLEEALKQTCEYLNIEFFNSNYLSLYRLGQQLLSLNCNHASFPLTLQAFLTLHLAKLPSLPGNFDCSSVIYKFYEGYINGNFLKKIKDKVSQCVSHWSDRLTDVEKPSRSDSQLAENEEDSKEMKFLECLTSILTAMQGWLVESRIYESGLYLPALPPHLMPDKLLLLFQENWDVWPELLDYEGIHKEEQKMLSKWNLHRGKCTPKLSPRGSPQRSSSSLSANKRNNLSPFKSILNRLKEYDMPKPQPPLPLFRSKIPTADATFDKTSIFYDIERHIDSMCTFSHSMYLWSREMCALDCVYTEMLPQMWRNQSTKTVMSVKCHPAKNSKISECSGAASIVVEFKEKRLNEAINARLDQNRDQYQSVLSQLMQPPSLQLVQGAIHLQVLVNHILNWHEKSKTLTGQIDQSLVEYGRKIFYLIIQKTNEETVAYPPAKQLITMVADLLGKEFLYGYSQCQEELFQQVITWDLSLAGLLSPNFTPLETDPALFLTLYGSLKNHISSRPDVCFMLLSKFEIETWLKMESISVKGKEELMDIIGSSLASLISLKNEDSPSVIMCLELYRVHIMAILKQDFPRHFSQLLKVLFDISSNSNDPGNVVESLWYDLLNSIVKGVGTLTPVSTNFEISACLKNFCLSQNTIPSYIVKETIANLSTCFIQLRLEHSLYGLYPNFKLHFRPILILIALLSHCHIALSKQELPDFKSNTAIRELWSLLESLWSAWISPLGGHTRNLAPKWIRELSMNKRYLLPWTPVDNKGPLFAMNMFASCISFFHEIFNGCNILAFYLEYYHRTLASPEVPSYILSVVHSQMNSLPWHHLDPSLKDVELFCKIINEYLPDCHSFIGGIFVQIPWNNVIRGYLGNPAFSPDIERTESSNKNLVESPGKSSELARIHCLLLGILVRISMEPSVRQSGLLHPLLTSAENFIWEFLDGQKFETILNWLVMGCDPRIILNMESRNPVDVALIHLLHVAAGYMPKLDHPDSSTKRRLLVKVLVRLLITTSTRHKALLRSQPSLFQATFAIWLSHMEDVIVELPKEKQYEEGFILACEAITTIGGGASPPHLQEVCRDSMVQWFAGHHPTQVFILALSSAISRGVLQLNHRSALLESSLKAEFAQQEVCSKNKPSSWQEIIGILSFPLTNPMSMLTYAAQENHLMLIYAQTRWYLDDQDVTSDDEEKVLLNLMNIFPLICPEEKCEKGLLLIVNQALCLVKVQVERKENLPIAWRQTRELVDLLDLWGEDRSSVGLLAAIGLGKKSLLSVSSRLICKSLRAFLLAQLISPGIFAVINEHHDETDGDTNSDEALKAVKHLASLKNNSEYIGMKKALDYAISFIQDCCHSIFDVSTLIGELVEILFPKDAILQPLFVKAVETENCELSLDPESGQDNGAYLPTAPPSFMES